MLLLNTQVTGRVKQGCMVISLFINELLKEVCLTIIGVRLGILNLRILFAVLLAFDPDKPQTGILNRINNVTDNMNLRVNVDKSQGLVF